MQQRHFLPRGARAVDKQEIKAAVEAIQWQVDGMLQVRCNLAARNVYAALDEPQGSPQ